MASASSTSAKTLFAESRMRLSDRIQSNINNVASLARQIQRGSKSSDMMMQTARSMAALDPVMSSTESNLNWIRGSVKEREILQDSLTNQVAILEEVKEQISAMQR